MRTKHPSAVYLMLAAAFCTFLFSGCTVVNYCIGTHMDEWREQRHSFRKGDERMIRDRQEVTVITTGGATLHGTLLGTRKVSKGKADAADGGVALAGLDLPVPPVVATPGKTLCISLAMPDSSTLEVPLDEVYLIRAEYGPPHLWKRTLPIPGMVIDAAAILLISGTYESP